MLWELQPCCGDSKLSKESRLPLLYKGGVQSHISYTRNTLHIQRMNLQHTASPIAGGIGIGTAVQRWVGSREHNGMVGLQHSTIGAMLWPSRLGGMARGEEWRSHGHAGRGGVAMAIGVGGEVVSRGSGDSARDSSRVGWVGEKAGWG